jgi:hypothetical protein
MAEEQSNGGTVDELLRALRQLASVASKAASDLAHTVATGGAQKRLADLLGDLSEQSRKMSERIATWSEDEPPLADRGKRVVKPLLEKTEELAKAGRTFADRLRQE